MLRKGNAAFITSIKIRNLTASAKLLDISKLKENKLFTPKNSKKKPK
jgi:hypothetical protein